MEDTIENQDLNQSKPTPSSTKRPVPQSLQGWHSHISQYHKENPGITRKQALKDASESYRAKKKSSS